MSKKPTLSKQAILDSHTVRAVPEVLSRAAEKTVVADKRAMKKADKVKKEKILEETLED